MDTAIVAVPRYTLRSGLVCEAELRTRNTATNKTAEDRSNDAPILRL